MKGKTNELVIRVILHILVWLLLFALPLYSSRRFQLGNDFLLASYTFVIISGLIFYINYLLLVPEFFFKKKRYRYYISALVLVFCFYFITEFASKQVFSYITKDGSAGEFDRPPDQVGRPQPGQPPRGRLMGPRILAANGHIIGYMSYSLFMVFLSLGLRVLERQTKIEKMQEEMEKAKLNAELVLLKNQISPHFFFNTLNNIYSLIGVNAEDSQKAVLKLSKLMRYLLYESEQGNVRLSNEIDFMKNYIDLMKLRMSERVILSVSFPEKYDDRELPPLLFIPFVENAFKHGVSYRESSFINIALEVRGPVLKFTCINSFHPRKETELGEKGGIGLENVRKRLTLLFPGKHDLSIRSGASGFEVQLELKLTNDTHDRN